MKRIYGESAMRPKGIPENEKLCIVEVWPNGIWGSRQCSRKRGHGKDGLYCKQHAKNHKAISFEGVLVGPLPTE